MRVLTIWLACLLLAASAQSAPAPYPASPVIAGITWDWSTTWGPDASPARGSDQWPATWADDDNLYLCWGDGGGFGGSNQVGRASFGVGRITGTPPDWHGVNIWGGKDPLSPQPNMLGKARILCVGGVLWLWCEKQSDWTSTRLIHSTDHGMTWTAGPFILESPLNRFCPVQFGRNYQGARDNYVYGFFADLDGRSLDLARVPVERLDQRRAYEVYAGTDKERHPKWSAKLADRQPVFKDMVNGVNWGYQCVYDRYLKRYLLTVTHGQVKGGPKGIGAGLGVFDAAEPWGPWTTAYFSDQWKDALGKFCFSFPAKWMNRDGRTLWMIHSGWPEYDGYYHVKCQLQLRHTVQAPAVH